MANHRISIAHDDYLRVRELFNIEEDSRPSFVLLLHRLVECIDVLLEKDKTGIEEGLHMKWALDEANFEHWLKEKGEQNDN